MRYLALLLLATTAHAQDATFDDGVVPAGSSTAWRLVTGWFPPYTQYVRPDADFPYPVGIMMQVFPDVPGITCIQQDGWGISEIQAAAMPGCKFTIQTTYSHYAPDPPGPKVTWADAFYKHVGLDFGGPVWGTDQNGPRIVRTLQEIADRGYKTDRGAGIRIGGNCYGGSAALTQSLILPDPLWQQQVTIVDAILPGMTADQPHGKYWMGEAEWDFRDGTKIDIERFQHSKNIRKLRNIYYKMQAAAYYTDGGHDDIGFNQDFRRDVCEKGIACYIIWSRAPHQIPDPESPLNYQVNTAGLFFDNNANNRLDQTMVIFTGSTANYPDVNTHAPRGYYNLGHGWNSKAIIDTSESLTVPIRYQAQSNLGPLLPDQPESATFNLTLRHPQRFQLRKWQIVHYKIGDVEGDAMVTRDNEVTIEGITLKSGDAYSEVVITDTGTAGC